MDEVVASTTVHVPPEEVFDFLSDFPGYAKYSTHLDSVEQFGEGGEGTEYRLHLSWWKVSHTVTTKVMKMTPPEEIHWETQSAVDADGRWIVEPLETDTDRTETRVTLLVRYDPNSARLGGLDVPRFVSTGWIIRRVKPLIEPEAERIVGRIVRELEGSPRQIDLTIKTRQA